MTERVAGHPRLKDVDGRDIGAKQSFVASSGHDGETMPGTSARSKASSPRPVTTCYGHQRQHRTRKVVITGLVPVIHVFLTVASQNVDARDIGAKQSFVVSPGHDAERDKPGHDDRVALALTSCAGLDVQQVLAGEFRLVGNEREARLGLGAHQALD